MKQVYPYIPFIVLFIQIVLFSIGLSKRKVMFITSSAVLGIISVAAALSCTIYQG